MYVGYNVGMFGESFKIRPEMCGDAILSNITSIKKREKGER